MTDIWWYNICITLTKIVINTFFSPCLNHNNRRKMSKFVIIVQENRIKHDGKYTTKLNNLYNALFRIHFLDHYGTIEFLTIFLWGFWWPTEKEKIPLEKLIPQIVNEMVEPNEFSTRKNWRNKLDHISIIERGSMHQKWNGNRPRKWTKTPCPNSF